MVDGTRELLAAAKEAGVGRFVLMSALGTSEETKDLVPYYGAKWQMERLVRSSGIPFVIFRPSFIFGPDGGILPTFVKLARLAPVTPIIGSGDQRIQPIWADDIAAYFAEATERDDVTGRLFELGGPDAVSWNEFWERLKRVRHMRRPSVHVPVGVMRVNALVTERLPGNIPLTRDLLKMLERSRQRRLERRRASDVRAAARPARRAAASSRLSDGPKNMGPRVRPHIRLPALD